MNRAHGFALATILMISAGCNAKQPAPAAESAAPPPPATASSDMRDPGPLWGEWRWVRTVTPVETIVCADPSRYTLAFRDSGHVAARVDCNRGSGTFTQSGRSLSFGPMGVTRMMCPPGSQDTQYMKQLGGAASCFMSGDTLMIDLKMDSGTMRFVRGS